MQLNYLFTTCGQAQPYEPRGPGRIRIALKKIAVSTIQDFRSDRQVGGGDVRRVIGQSMAAGPGIEE